VTDKRGLDFDNRRPQLLLLLAILAAGSIISWLMARPNLELFDREAQAQEHLIEPLRDAGFEFSTVESCYWRGEVFMLFITVSLDSLDLSEPVAVFGIDVGEDAGVEINFAHPEPGVDWGVTAYERSESVELEMSTWVDWVPDPDELPPAFSAPCYD